MAPCSIAIFARRDAVALADHIASARDDATRTGGNIRFAVDRSGAFQDLAKISCDITRVFGL